MGDYCYAFIVFFCSVFVEVFHLPDLIDFIMPTAGQRLKHFAQAWRDMGASPKVMSWIEDGYSIPIDPDEPIKLVFPSPKLETVMSSPEKHLRIQKEVQDLLFKRAERVVTGCKLGFYSKFFLVPKPTVDGVTKWRPCINLKPLNKHILKEKFK